MQKFDRDLLMLLRATSHQCPLCFKYMQHDHKLLAHMAKHFEKLSPTREVYSLPEMT